MGFPIRRTLVLSMAGLALAATAWAGPAVSPDAAERVRRLEERVATLELQLRELRRQLSAAPESAEAADPSGSDEAAPSAIRTRSGVVLEAEDDQ